MFKNLKIIPCNHHYIIPAFIFISDFAFDMPQEKITRPVIDFATFLSEDVAGRRKPAVGSRRPPAVVVKMVTEAPRGARGSRRRRV